MMSIKTKQQIIDLNKQDLNTSQSIKIYWTQADLNKDNKQC